MKFDKIHSKEAIVTWSDTYLWGILLKNNRSSKMFKTMPIKVKIIIFYCNKCVDMNEIFYLQSINSRYTDDDKIEAL